MDCLWSFSGANGLGRVQGRLTDIIIHRTAGSLYIFYVETLFLTLTQMHLFVCLLSWVVGWRNSAVKPGADYFCWVCFCLDSTGLNLNVFCLWGRLKQTFYIHGLNSGSRDCGAQKSLKITILSFIAIYRPTKILIVTVVVSPYFYSIK